MQDEVADIRFDQRSQLVGHVHQGGVHHVVLAESLQKGSAIEEGKGLAGETRNMTLD